METGILRIYEGVSASKPASVQNACQKMKDLCSIGSDSRLTGEQSSGFQTLASALVWGPLAPDVD
eukprot:3755783-Alexandrium_andersonii.AAC.1